MTRLLNTVELSMFLILIVVSSCSKEEGSTTYETSVVVESYLLPGEPLEVQLTEEIAYFSENTTEQSIENIDLTITEDGVAKSFHHSGDGKFVSDSNWVVKEGSTYQLEFRYNEETIRAETNVPAKPQGLTCNHARIEIEPIIQGSGVRPTFSDENINVEWTNTTGEYYLVAVENREEEPMAIIQGDLPARQTIRNEPNQSDFFDITARTFTHYGTHRIILYRLSPEYAALYVDNGSSSLDLQEPSSNVENGLGIFTGLNTDTIFLDVVVP